MGWLKNRKKAERRKKRGGRGQNSAQEPHAYQHRRKNGSRQKDSRYKPTPEYLAVADAEADKLAAEELARSAPAESLDQQDQPSIVTADQQAGTPIAAQVAPEPQQAADTAQVAEDSGGSGGRNNRTASGLTGIREERMLGRAIEQGWQGIAGWPTGWTTEDFKLRAQTTGGLLTIKERTALAIMQDVGADDSRIRQIAARNALTMESQNIYERHHDGPKGQRGIPQVGINLKTGSDGTSEIGVLVYVPDNGRDPTDLLIDKLELADDPQP